MSQLFNYDPLTGIKEYFSYDEATGVASVRHEQDVSESIDYSKTLANTGATDKGIKEGMWHYASIPPIVQINLRSMGIDIYSREPAMQNRMLAALDEHYPWLKTTTKKHRVKAVRHQ